MQRAAWAAGRLFALEKIMEEKRNPLRYKNRPQCGLLIENGRGEVLLQLRDNKPEIPYPNTWGTFGGQIEAGEQPEQAVIREIKEELDYQPKALEQYGLFPCDGYDIYMFCCCDPGLKLDALQVHEGQRAEFFSSADLDGHSFAFNCREIVQDYYARFYPEVTVFIGLGSNMGDREKFLKEALQKIGQLMSIEAVSSIYETEPVDYEDQGWFLNMAVQGKTRLFPEVLLEKLQRIEAGMGRQRAVPKGPRTIDLDMLFYGQAVIATGRLTIPHPRLHERAFVLAPFAEIAPGFVHPALGQTVSALLARADSRKQVVRYRSSGP